VGLNFSIRDIRLADHDRIVDLNSDVVEWTSPMNNAQLQELVSMAVFRKAIVSDNAVIGFILVMADSCPYVNDNFFWFAERYSSFLYIDRIVVDSSNSRSGYGRALYEQLISYGRESSREHLVCEYTFNPLNKGSCLFHQRLGFSEVGRRQLRGSEKIVSMQSKRIISADSPKGSGHC